MAEEWERACAVCGCDAAAAGTPPVHALSRCRGGVGGGSARVAGSTLAFNKSQRCGSGAGAGGRACGTGGSLDLVPVEGVHG